jgi:hypothetical protein
VDISNNREGTNRATSNRAAISSRLIPLTGNQPSRSSRVTRAVTGVATTLCVRNSRLTADTATKMSHLMEGTARTTEVLISPHMEDTEETPLAKTHHRTGAIAGRVKTNHRMEDTVERVKTSHHMAGTVEKVTGLPTSRLFEGTRVCHPGDGPDRAPFHPPRRKGDKRSVRHVRSSSHARTRDGTASRPPKRWRLRKLSERPLERPKLREETSLRSEPTC